MPEPRLEPLTPESLSNEQRVLYDAVLASPRGQGPMKKLLIREDGSLSGPFDAWLRSPALGIHFERAGNAFRAETDYPETAREVAVLVVARAWSADFEWWAHSILARRAEVPESVIEAIGLGRRPEFDDDAMRVAHDVAYELVHRRRLADATLGDARKILGIRATVELITLVGFYQLVSGVLESFHPPGPSADLPVVGPPPLPERAGLDLFDAASTTRSVRRLRPDPIPQDTLKRVFTAATWAPSGANQQPWRILAVDDPDTKAGLATLYAGEWADYANASRERIVGLPDDMKAGLERNLAAGDFLATNLAETPVIALFCFNPEQLHVTDLELDRPSVVGGASLYPAVQNLLLACRAEGLGCVLTTLLCAREEEVRDLLSIPEPWGIHAMVPIGWPVGGGHGPLSRRPVEEAVYRNHFGQEW